jgi:hypothetical protein
MVQTLTPSPDFDTITREVYRTLYTQFDRPSQWFLVCIVADYLRSGSSWELLLDLHDPDAVISEEVSEFVLSLYSYEIPDLWDFLRAIVFRGRVRAHFLSTMGLD